jgi:aconitate hydratase
MGQAPATGRISLRTVPRNFPGRSGTKEDAVHLCSPETATASAITGRITDPRDLETDLGMPYPRFEEPEEIRVNDEMLIPPPEDGSDVELVKGPNITSVPDLEPLAEALDGPVLMKVGNDVSTDEILPAGTEVLPFRSNLPEPAKFSFRPVDPTWADRAAEHDGFHAVVAGDNYGQGSSREHAALAPRSLGLRAVLAVGFSRIHWQNLANFGVLPLTIENADDYDQLAQGDELRLENLHAALQQGNTIEVRNLTRGETIRARHDLSERQVRTILAGGLIPLQKQRLDRKAA